MPSDLGSPAILVFSKTNSFRHVDGIAGGIEALEELAIGNAWDVMASENGAIFNAEDLARFEVVIFLNASGDMLSLEQEQQFQRWLEAGGGWIGIHAAGDGSHAGWNWYMENLIGAEFTAHIMGPQFQRANVVMESPDHPVVKRVPNIWPHTEEWYSWKKSPRAKGFTILATLDEDSYSPMQNFMGQKRDLRMGDHPVVWSNCVGRGRSVYFAMGHQADAFASVEFRNLLVDALRWTMGLEEGGCEEAP
jgi:type 1 glutamine amidotransferase